MTKTELINGWAKYYNPKSTQVLAAKLTKGNMKSIAKAIADRLDTIGIVGVSDDAIRWTHQRIEEEKQLELTLGQYLVMTNTSVITMPAHEFKWKYKEIIPPMPSWYTPTENEVKIILCLNSDEYFYGYDYICDQTELSRSETKEAIDKLRMVGVVQFLRGLMTEDGDVAGAGFGIRNTARAEALLYRYYLSKGNIPEWQPR